LQLTLAGLLLVGCASLAGDPPDASECSKVHGTAALFQLCVSIDRQHADHWFVRRKGIADLKLEGLSFTDGGLASFGEFSISPLGNWLAVTTADEGHPALKFRQLSVLLDSPEQEQPDTPRIAVYPGGLSIEGWKDDANLIISSDQDLLHRDAQRLLDDEQRYLVHLPDGAISLFRDSKTDLPQ